jgi:hypothetical protein
MGCDEIPRREETSGGTSGCTLPAKRSRGFGEGSADVLVEFGNRHNAAMRVERIRDNVFTVTATSQELSALVGAARMALEAMRGAPDPPPREAIEVLERVLNDFDRVPERMTEANG